MDEYRSLHRKSIEDPEGFWRTEAKKLAWFREFETVCE